MLYTPNARDFAISTMEEINPQLTEKFAYLIEFLSDNPELTPASRSRNIETGSEEHIRKLANNFNSSRAPRAPRPPSTVPDNMVSNILNKYFGVDTDQLEETKRLHLLSMGAENIVGDLLERYLASVIEPQGWVWCSGATIKAVDFIKPPMDQDDEWTVLQVKNRDNSENSSSSAIRNGTIIKKWHRTYAKTGRTNWDAFPCEIAAYSLNEERFTDYVDQYLSNLN